MLDQLIVFDVDGTLCATCGVDYDCFLATACELLALPHLAPSWDTFPHVTDTGIVDALWQQHVGRPPTPMEVETFATNFESRLIRQLEHSPKRFRPVAGASQLVAHLQAIGVEFAFATGGWSRTACLKLRAAGLPVNRLLASSDDSFDRSEIFRLATVRAKATAQAQLSGTILVGDGTWDVRVASLFRWSLVGVGCDAQAAQLRAAGARVVIPDFADLNLTMAALSDARRLAHN